MPFQKNLVESLKIMIGAFAGAWFGVLMSTYTKLEVKTTFDTLLVVLMFFIFAIVIAVYLTILEHRHRK